MWHTQLLVVLTDNDFFGENSLLDGTSRTATATIECASFVELLTLSLKSLQRVLAENRHDAAALLRESACIRDRQAAGDSMGTSLRRMSYDDSPSAKQVVSCLNKLQRTKGDADAAAGAPAAAATTGGAGGGASASGGSLPPP